MSAIYISCIFTVVTVETVVRSHFFPVSDTLKTLTYQRFQRFLTAVKIYCHFYLQLWYLLWYTVVRLLWYGTGFVVITVCVRSS